MQLSGLMCGCLFHWFLYLHNESYFSVSRPIDSVPTVVSSLDAHVSSDVLQIPILLRHSAT